MQMRNFQLEMKNHAYMVPITGNYGSELVIIENDTINFYIALNMT